MNVAAVKSQLRWGLDLMGEGTTEFLILAAQIEHLNTNTVSL